MASDQTEEQDDVNFEPKKQAKTGRGDKPAVPWSHLEKRSLFEAFGYHIRTFKLPKIAECQAFLGKNTNVFDPSRD